MKIERMIVLDTVPSRVIISFCLVILIALFRCVETAADVVSESRLKNRADDGSKRAKRLIRIFDEQGKLYNCMRFVIILIELILTAFVTVNIAPEWNFSYEILNYALSLGILAVAVLVLGVYLPRRISVKNPEKILFSLSWLFFTVYYIFTPIVTVLSFIADLLSRIFGVNPNEQNDEVTEEEIRSIVDAGSESGAIDDDEKEMIHNIFELDEISVESVMTHRTDVIFLWMEDLQEWEEIIDESNHSIYPVCGEKVDDIIGIIYSRDFLRLLRKKDSVTEADVKGIFRQPYFVPESIKAKDLFKKMQGNKTHFAVVLDEYGGLGGIITMSDLLEEIVGDLDNEYDGIEDEEITQIDSNTWRILGSADIDIVSEFLNIELPVEEYNTFAGMILGQLGSIPEDGTTTELEAFGMNIKVTKIEEHRIEEAIVCLIEPVKEQDEE